ncbi:MAG: xylulokinase [Fusicatenibacter sp.]|nr:xylulokinase [Fusicatenibacter sp.]
MYYIGVDLGTSAVKLLLMDGTGRIVNIVSREYPLYFPHPGWSEQKPEDWWKESKEGIKELVKDVDKSQVAGISFGGQMHGLVILDEEDQVIRPAILWNDGRTGKQTDYLNNVIGKANLSMYTANIAFAGFTAPKILWVKENEPENFARIAKIMLPKDYLAYCLSGAFVSDYSDASGMLLMDVKNKCWSKRMIEICGISEEMLPTLHESYDAVGTLKPEVAKELGLPESCKVVAGAGDNAAAAVGTGTVGDGMCNISLGTSGTIFISSREFGVDSNNALHAFAHADGHYHLMGCMLSAASCNKWWMDQIIRTKDYPAEQKDITKLGENNVFFLPYLMGERSPHNNPDARGTFIGLTMDTTREDMTQAVLEGVAFAIRDSFEIAKSLGIKIERTKICGGGAKSPLWRRMIANILNIKVDRIESEEGPALGGAILAAVACGEFESVEDAAAKIVRVTETIEPEPELVEKYEKQYRKFAQIYPTVKDLFTTLL